jgi:hypothetical protein
MKALALGMLFAMGASPTGCAKSEQSAPSPPPPPATATPGPSAEASVEATLPPQDAASAPKPSDETACVDKWLDEHGLDMYGHPKGAMYAGGTPLFNEVTGERRDRLEYVYERQPDARKACARPKERK